MTLEKIQKALFCLLIVLLPTQLGLHFWPGWAYINGVRIDYFSPTLYITDIPVLFLLLLEICALLRRIFALRQNGEQFSKKLLSYCFIGLLIYLNLVYSYSPAVSFYRWLKVAELAFLVWFVCKNKELLLNFHKFLLIPVFYESILAVWQFVAQSSIGGWWYFLGERTFNGGTLGIANTYINGQLVLRPYGTFPHPNVLGGFLAVVVPLILAHFLHNSRKLNVSGRLGILGILGLGYAGLFLSMSRAAILVGVVATIWIVVTRLRKKILWGMWGLMGTLGLILLPRFLALGLDTEPIVVRGQLNSLAWREFTSSPIWGTGLGTSPIYNLPLQGKQFTIYNYALAYQPTHNIYLLILAETGVLGLAVLGILGWWAIRKRSVPLLSILVLGLADHYFLTLQQGQLLLAVVLGTMMTLSNRRG